ncbi:MFS transporter [Bosea caraganae]|uniref:MFS transporter n=1 Tax=Bosea caraganae TaxID=2763117 RepID=A0A370KY74_9HYPH|nr:MFS transporter [Bosea caraganae]RDJ23869.1 MFS transporter [Bosea caraganae]
MAWVAPVAAILVLQTMAAFLTRVMPTVAPALFAEFGWANGLVGYAVAATTAGSMLVLLFGARTIHRVGSIRSMQLALGVGALGMVLLFAPLPGAAMLASAVMGLAHGVATPAGSDILQRFTPRNQRNLVFSIKQAGVPLGGVLAGALLPFIVERVGWRSALAAAAGMVACFAALTGLLRGQSDRTDDDEKSRPRPSNRLAALLAQPAQSLASLSSEPTLWRLSVAGALLATAQSCWLAFSVAFLVTEIGLPLTVAGLVFAVMQASGVVGRIALGWISDRIGSGIPTLQAAALASAATMVLLALADRQWPVWALTLLAIAGGISASGWNGVQIAEIAARSPPSLVRLTAAGSTILIFLGNIIAPALFTLCVTLSGRYDLAFAIVAIINLASLPCLLGLGRPPLRD